MIAYPKRGAKVEARKIYEKSMFKKWFRSKLCKFLRAEEYVKDQFDKEHLGFVYLGLTSIEDHEKIKKYYFEHKIHKINSSVNP